jgi:hypothetical protein
VRPTVDDVNSLLRPGDVIAACGLDARERGRAFRFRTCPLCGAHPKRGGAAIYRRRSDQAWRYTHHGHASCAGSLLDLIAVSERIDRKTEFPRLVARAATIAGIDASDPELEQKIAKRAANEAAEREREERARTAALLKMPDVWSSLARRSSAGKAYLATRGFEDDELRTQGDVVRYSDAGEVALAMRSLETGAVVGIQYRSIIGKGFRAEPYSEPSSSALGGRIAELDREGVDVAIVVEGLSDTLAARLAWPGCAVFGAAGVDHVEAVMEAVAARAVEIGGWVLLVVDDDEVGIEAGADAIGAAVDAGLVLDRTLHVVDVGNHHDLADAYAAGWRWSWPS